jgi:hypothetical protein
MIQNILLDIIANNFNKQKEEIRKSELYFSESKPQRLWHLSSKDAYFYLRIGNR